MSSKVIEEKIVQMQFDNKNFESNVKTTMSTLDKLKSLLGFEGATKGLSNIQSASSKVNFSGMSTALDSINVKFSALQVIGTTALANITNSAVNAGKKIISALTIDPIKTGFDEYELKMKSIQTILTNTASKGTDLQQVTTALDELNTYADQTIYNFAEMTSNIGRFTAAGVDLDKSVSSIKGISNLAAASGSDALQASTAMYQLSQALSTGTVKLMDWNSVVNAGMGGELFQEALKRTAREYGVNVDSIIKDNGSFRDSLHEGWLTADILNTTLKTFTKEGAKEYAESMQASGKYTEEQTKAMLEQAQMMTDAATKVRTFTQLISTLKESMQSGWAKTWELLVGDFYEATELLTGISDFLGGIINATSEWRNQLLESALGRSFTHISDGLKSVLDPLKKATDGISDINNELLDYTKVVDDIIFGKYKNAPHRFELLAEAGYDWAHAQNLVNEKLGNSYRYSTDYQESQKTTIELTEDQVKTNNELIASLVTMSDEELKAMGYTDEHIKSLRELQKLSDDLGMSVMDVLNNLDHMDGRWILWNSFANLGKSMISIFQALGNAWIDVFPPITADTLFNIIVGFHKLTEIIKNNVISNSENLKRTLRGVFSILGLITDVLGIGFKIGLEVVKAVLSVFNLDLLQFTAILGDAIYNFRQWIHENNLLFKAISYVTKAIVEFIMNIVDWVKVNEKLQNGLNNLKKNLDLIKESFKQWVQGFKNAENIPLYIIQGLVNGLKTFGKLAIDGIITLGKNILEAFKKILGIHSPSTEFFEFGKNIIQGLLNGIASLLSKVWNSITNIANILKNAFMKIDWGKIFAAGLSLAIVWLTKNIADMISNLVSAISAPLQGLGNLLSGFGSLAEDFGKSLKTKATADLIKSIALSILILAGALWVFSQIPEDRLLSSLATLGAVSIGLLAFVAILSKIDLKGTSMLSVAKLAVMIVGISIVLVALASSLNKMSGLTWEQLAIGLTGLAGVITILFGFITSVAILGSKFKQPINEFNSLLIKLSISLLLFVGFLKLASLVTVNDIESAIGILLLFISYLTVLGLASKVGKNTTIPFVSMMVSVSFALLLFIGFLKLSDSINIKSLDNAIYILTLFTLFLLGMSIVSKIGAGTTGKFILLIIALSIALNLFVGFIKLCGILNINDLKNGTLALGALGIFLGVLIASSKFAGAEAHKAALMIIAISASMLLLVASLYLLGKINPSELEKSLKVIGIISLMISGLMIASSATGNANTEALTRIIVGISVLLLAVVALTFLDQNKLLRTVSSISILLVAFGAMIKLAGSTPESTITKVWKSLIPMLLVVTAITAILIALSFLPNIDSLLPKVASLSILMISLATTLTIISKIPNTSFSTTLKNIGLMTLMVIPLGIFCLALSQLNIPFINPKDILSIGVLILAMSGIMFILDKMKLRPSSTITGILGLTAMIVPLEGFIASIKKLEGVSVSTSTILNISLLMGMMTVLMLALMGIGLIMTASSGIGAAGVLLGILGLAAMITPLLLFIEAFKKLEGVSVSTATILNISLLMGTMSLLMLALMGIGSIMIATSGIGAAGVILGIIALTAMVIPLKLFIDTLKEMNNIKNAETNILAINLLMVSLTDMLVKLSLVSPLLMLANVALLGLVGVMAVVGILVTTVGMLLTAFPQLGEFVKTGLPLLELLALGIGRMIGNFTQGLSEGVGNSLVKLGDQLSLFGKSIEPFFKMISTWDDKVLNGIGILAAAVIALTAGTLLEGITSLLTGGDSFSKLGTELSKFAIAALPFINIMSMFDPKVAESIKSLATALILITGNQLLSGINNFLGGGNSLDAFASQLPILGNGISAFSESLKDFTPDKVGIVESAAKAIQILAEAADTLPNDGGWLGAIVGENSISAFGNQLPELGTHLNSFVNNLGDFTDSQVSTIDAAGRAIKTLAEAADALPNDGGWIASLVGENSIGAFGDQLPGLGTNLSSFVNNLSTFSNDQVTSVEAASKAIKILAEAAEALPNEGGFWNSIFGDNSLANFGKQLPELGTAIKSFCDTVSGLTGDQVSSVNSAVQAIQAIAGLAGVNLKDASNNLPDFGGKLKSFGNDFKSFISGLTTIGEDKTELAYKSIDSIINTINKISSVDINALTGFVKSLSDFGKNGLNGFVDGFSSVEAKNNATSGMNDLVVILKSYINSKKEELKTSFKELGQEGLNGLSDQGLKSQATDLGKDFVLGFANGITNNKYLARDAASSVGKTALLAAKAAIDSNSPSKEAMDIGNDFDDGLAIGINELANKVYNSAYDVGTTAKNGLSKAISNISTLVEDNAGSGPIIRPVLDLSEVESGANGINSLFNNKSLSVAGNLAAINAASINNQNGNNEVISAIKSLGKSLSGNNNTQTYNINGVTYDDGSNITQAVESIVKAAKVERRK